VAEVEEGFGFGLLLKFKLPTGFDVTPINGAAWSGQINWAAGSCSILVGSML